MSIFLDPTGRSTYGIAICGRCSRKFYLEQLFPDPNSPGLMVCAADLDNYDPYRLAPPPADPIALLFVRPDVSIATNPGGLIADNGDEFLTTEDGEGYLLP